MKDGMRFVDCDMHVMEPADLFDRYLDPKFKDRVITDGAYGRPGAGRVVIDGLSRTGDEDTQQYRKRSQSVASTNGNRCPARAQRPTWTSQSSAATTPKPRSRVWRWKGSTSPSFSPPWALG